MPHSAPVNALSAEDAAVALRYLVDLGVDEAIQETPVDHFAAAAPPQDEPATTKTSAPDSPQAIQKPVQTAQARPTPIGAEEAIAEAKQRAQGAESLVALQTLLAEFDGCPLKRHAQNLVFGDGIPDADILFIGDAPGAEEDRQGQPFVGDSGRMFDRMLQFIQLDRRRVYMTNMVFWRPPGNRTPTEAEIAICAPFLERLIALIAPKIIIPLGGTAAKTLLNSRDGVTKLRGRWGSIGGAHPLFPTLTSPIEALPMLHPDYLLKTSAQKKLAWRDALSLREKLNLMGIATEPL